MREGLEEGRESGKHVVGFQFFLGTQGVWECGKRGAIYKGGGKGGKPGFGFPGFPRTAISTAFARLRWSNRDYGVECCPGRVLAQEEYWRFFRGRSRTIEQQ